MGNKRIISFFGAGQTDICLYLGAILSRLKISVYVIDNSYDQLIKYCIPKKCAAEKTVHGGVSYRFMIEPSMWTEIDAQVVIVDMGVWPGDDAIGASDAVYMVSDMSVSRLLSYRELMKRLQIPVSVILRDTCEEAVRSDNVLHLLSEGNPFVYEEHKLPLNEDDRILWLLMQYHRFDKFAYISSEMERLLTDIVRHNIQVSAHGLSRAIKEAKKGGQG